MQAATFRSDTLARVSVDGTLGEDLRSAVAQWAEAAGVTLEWGEGGSPFRLLGSFRVLRQVLPQLRSLMEHFERKPSFVLSPLTRAA
jgi:hypothetical protein